MTFPVGGRGNRAAPRVGRPGDGRRYRRRVAKPSYKTFVVERQIPAPRAAVWPTLVELLDAGLVDRSAVGAEHVLSLEPPWRRAARLDLAPFLLAEHTVALRDDGDECRLVWAYVTEPPAGEDARVDAALARLQDALTAWADQVAARSTAAA
jgi:hypothetical protein